MLGKFDIYCNFGFQKIVQRFKNASVTSCLTCSKYISVNLQLPFTLLTKIESFCSNDFPVMPNGSLAQVGGRKGMSFLAFS